MCIRDMRPTGYFVDTFWVLKNYSVAYNSTTRMQGSIVLIITYIRKFPILKNQEIVFLTKFLKVGDEVFIKIF